MQAVDLLTVGDGVRGRRNTPVRATRRTPCGARGAVGAYSSRPGAYVQPSMARRASHLSEPSQQLGCAAPRKSRFLDVRCNAGAATDKPADTVTAADRREGRILLGFVGATYGSLAAVLKYVFLLPGPPTASVLSTSRGLMAAICFIPFMLQEKSRAQLANWTKQEWWAALELAVWNFASQSMLNVALLFTDAMRASFITQTAIVLTPVISSLRGQRVANTTWIGCAFALAGVAALAGDTGGTVAAASTVAKGLNIGDCLALGGAVSYSLYIFRLSELGAKGLSTDLTQAVKTFVLAGLYLIWTGVDAAAVLAKGGSLLSMWPNWTSTLAWGILAYSAIVPGALADIMQGRGQAKLGATESQVLLSAEPLWTATISMLLLGERMGKAGWFGGSLVVIAVILATGVVDPFLPGGQKKKAE